MKQYGFRWRQSTRPWPIAHRYARARPRWLGMDSLCSEEWARIVEPLLVGPWWGDP